MGVYLEKSSSDCCVSVAEPGRTSTWKRDPKRPDRARNSRMETGVPLAVRRVRVRGASMKFPSLRHCSLSFYASARHRLADMVLSSMLAAWASGVIVRARRTVKP